MCRERMRRPLAGFCRMLSLVMLALLDNLVYNIIRDAWPACWLESISLGNRP